MTDAAAVRETRIEGLPEPTRGKVRDVYDLGERLAIVATDRISCFDVVLPTPIPGKGKVLTKLTAHWLTSVVTTRNHLITTDVAQMPAPLCDHAELLAGRTMYVERSDVFPVECIVRGYLAGSGVAQYERDQAICGVDLPAGLRKFSRLPEPIFTPSTKAGPGEKDRNIDLAELVEIVGAEWAERLRDESLALYTRAAEAARERGVLIADTKLEWGRAADGALMLVDEVLTPDSSRFWPADTYVEGERADSFDKQFVRDWLLETGWDKVPPAPELPAELVEKTRGLYHRVVELLTGDAL